MPDALLLLVPGANTSIEPLQALQYTWNALFRETVDA